MIKSATISDCKLYRYDLWRKWDDETYCMFIGLNPSIADAEQDDPTIRRCIQYSKDWGYGGLCMVNLFAYRSTDPKNLKLVNNPVGEFNDENIKYHSSKASKIIAAWGKDGKYLDRDREVAKIAPNLHCLKLNKDYTPAHPLYLKKDAVPFPFNII